MSRPGETLLRPVHGASGIMIPYIGGEDRLGQAPLYEMVLPSDAPDGPQPSFYSDDGFYHTGDLFEEIEPEAYVFRGRTGDWIKTIEGMCDTKYAFFSSQAGLLIPGASNRSIEDGIRSNCEDLIEDVVVVGQMRPAPCMFVESKRSGLTEDEALDLKVQIIARLKTFNKRLFRSERVESPGRILILDKGTLPRTTVSLPSLTRRM